MVGVQTAGSVKKPKSFWQAEYLIKYQMPLDATIQK